MLVISRKKDETILIGDSIEVSVIDIRGDKVRIGVSCPADVPVHRREVYEAIRRSPSLWEPAPTLPTASSFSAAMAEPVSRPISSAAPAVAAEPATLKLSAQGISRLDKLRQAGELSREATMETLLEVVDQAEVTSLCDLEKRLDRPF